MIITHIRLQNWKNFLDAEAGLRDVTYLIGANAAGKSNFLDAFRFLRDVTKTQGGGLQKAILDRRGLSKIRCLHARRNPQIRIEAHLAENADEPHPKWRYVLALKSEAKGANRPVIAAEEVYLHENGREQNLLRRPDAEDNGDPERLTQTSLEQIQSNQAYRELVEHFGSITYLHLVPQLLKYGDFIGGRQMENDPFGQAFLERVASVSEKTRKSRLDRIQRALASAIPQFEEIRFVRDEVSGRPHLEAKYSHHRPHAGWQREDQFPDGTLRLIGLLWLLLDGDGALLLEEPELSLDEEIVRNLPLVIDRVRRSLKRRGRQILLSTHSQALLENKGIDGRAVLRLERVHEGTNILAPTENELELMHSGLSAAEVLLPKAHPRAASEMAL